MNRLNGPYGYALQHAAVGDLWDIFDASSNRVAVCESSSLAQICAAALTDAWKRQQKAIEEVEAKTEATP